MFTIIWLYENREYIQHKQLISHTCQRIKSEYFSTNSPIYKAIEDGSFQVDLGYGVHKFKIIT